MRQLTTIDNDVEIHDLFAPNWRSERLIEDADILRTTKLEAAKAYLVADSVYGIPEYLDMLIFVNNITDILQLQPNTAMYVPKPPAIKDFIIRELQGS